eukprot:2287072-Lingulodinium_polyedra.AAC.1
MRRPQRPERPAGGPVHRPGLPAALPCGRQVWQGTPGAIRGRRARLAAPWGWANCQHPHALLATR